VQCRHEARRVESAIVASDTTLITLIFGGLGGAALTGVLASTSERRRSKREDQASQWLVTMELANANAGAQYILQGEYYTHFPTDAWREERPKLARALPREGFLVVAGAYNAIHGFNWRFDAQVFQRADPKNKELFRSCERMRETSKAALDVLDEVRK
jgi:hypothetical protein